MATETGIGWTTSTVNFWIGCTPVGPGCEGCYAFAWAYQKWGIVFEPGGERRATKVGFTEPLRWQRGHDAGKSSIINPHQHHWVFCNSLSDFFDKEAPAELRARAWAVIKACNHLRWQIVTKRIGNVERYLPADWNGGKGYEHVGIIATMVDQPEYDRDAEKLVALYELGVCWTGISMEPQLGHIQMHLPTDWIITGGESRQTAWERNAQGVLVKKPHEPRPYHTEWAASLIEQCAEGTRLLDDLHAPEWQIPVYVKQMGDAGFDRERPMKLSPMGKKPAEWPERIRVQQMPRIYDNEPVRTLL